MSTTLPVRVPAPLLRPGVAVDRLSHERSGQPRFRVSTVTAIEPSTAVVGGVQITWDDGTTAGYGTSEVFRIESDVVTSNVHNDAWTCPCGNDVMGDGFAPCDPATANTVTPTADDPWDGRSITCLSCRRVIDQATLMPNPNATNEWDSHLVLVVGEPRDDVDETLDAEEYA